MREVHYCNTCDRKLPYLVRLDAKFCESKCRVWAFRHPGEKRLKNSTERKRLTKRPKKAKSKSYAAALAALAESRSYAAKLEAAARDQSVDWHKLQTEISALRDELAEVIREKEAANDAMRDDLAKTKARLARVEQQKNNKIKQSYHRLRQTERLITRLKRAEREVAVKRSSLERAQADLDALRRSQEQQNAVQSSKLAEARAQAADLARARDDLAKQVQSLTDSADQLQSHAESIEQTLKQRDEELDEQRKLAETVKRAQEEADDRAESLKRSMEAEQARRRAAEQIVQQLQDGREHQVPSRATMSGPVSSSGEDRERLSARIRQQLDLGQYLEHAVAAGYDVTADPLFLLMRRHVVVADPYRDWQNLHVDRVTSRRRDPQQAIDEQAYAAVSTARWKLVDLPHVRRGKKPTWRRTGIQLDDVSEKYLWTIINEQIDEMTSRMGAFFELRR